MMGKHLIRGQKIEPLPIGKNISAVELIEGTFFAYNASRLRESCELATKKMQKNDVLIGWTLTGALTPAGLGISCLIPLMRHGFIDWIVSTGANLYHDLHFTLGKKLYRGTPQCNDCRLREERIVRIYDILFHYDVLLSTDRFLQKILASREFQTEMSSSELHNLLGKYVSAREKKLGIGMRSILSAAYTYGIPVYTSSPGDSSIGMNIAALALAENKLKINTNLDVNESASIVYGTKKNGGKSALVILGGGSPKNFILQTEPHIQEILGLSESGHDYFIQITDARPDTGGLSGATPNEAVSWGKIDPGVVPDTVVVYADITVALPLLTAYILASGRKKKHKRLFENRSKLLTVLRKDLKLRFPKTEQGI